MPSSSLRSVGLVDLMPSLLEMARVPAPSGLDGTSWLPMLRDDFLAKAPGHPVVAEVDGPPVPGTGRPTRLCSVRDERAKWILAFDAFDGTPIREEGYDLLADPGERTRLKCLAPPLVGPEFVAAVEGVREHLRESFAPPPMARGASR